MCQFIKSRSDKAANRSVTDPLFCEERMQQSSTPQHLIVSSHREHIATRRAICNQLDVVLPEIFPVVD